MQNQQTSVNEGCLTNENKASSDAGTQLMLATRQQEEDSFVAARTGASLAMGQRAVSVGRRQNQTKITLPTPPLPTPHANRFSTAPTMLPKEWLFPLFEALSYAPVERSIVCGLYFLSMAISAPPRMVLRNIEGLQVLSPSLFDLRNAFMDYDTTDPYKDDDVASLSDKELANSQTPDGSQLQLLQIPSSHAEKRNHHRSTRLLRHNAVAKLGGQSIPRIEGNHYSFHPPDGYRYLRCANGCPGSSRNHPTKGFIALQDNEVGDKDRSEPCIGDTLDDAVVEYPRRGPIVDKHFEDNDIGESLVDETQSQEFSLRRIKTAYNYGLLQPANIGAFVLGCEYQRFTTLPKRFRFKTSNDWGLSYSLVAVVVALTLKVMIIPEVGSNKPCEGCSSSEEKPADLRDNITKGLEPCFHYIAEHQLFQMNCSVLHWQAHRYGADTHISLSANEVFDGAVATSGGDDNAYIDLDGIEDFRGMFKIDENDVTSFDKAPVIRNVHVKNGKVAKKGGFIVRKEQTYFVVDSCSSTGQIAKRAAGGICGYRCAHGGEIEIIRSFSTGNMLGTRTGGITGKYVGFEGGTVTITQCHSAGNIEGDYAGGICGHVAADGGDYGDSELTITQCYSLGDILSRASEAGGIVGTAPGTDGGRVYIRECYSQGKIAAAESGGISGAWAAHDSGEVNIVDCYTQGNIKGEWAGGIAGWRTGGYGSNAVGDVYIERMYASGSVTHSKAGAIIGRINTEYTTPNVYVRDSVFSTDQKVGNDYSGSTLVLTGNFYNLDVIRGQLLSHSGEQKWKDDVWAIAGTEQFPILRFQLPSSSPSPSSTSTGTPTSSVTPSMTPTPSVTNTATQSKTETLTPTGTVTTSRTETPSPSTTDTPSKSVTSSFSPSLSASITPTPTVTRSMTGSRTESPTPTKSSTTSPSSSSTSTSSPSKSAPVRLAKRALPVQRPQRIVQRHSNGRSRKRER